MAAAPSSSIPPRTHQATSQSHQNPQSPQDDANTENGWGWPGNLLNIADFPFATTTSNAMSVFGISESPRKPQNKNGDSLSSQDQLDFFGLARITSPTAVSPRGNEKSPRGASGGGEEVGGKLVEASVGQLGAAAAEAEAEAGDEEVGHCCALGLLIVIMRWLHHSPSLSVWFVGH